MRRLWADPVWRAQMEAAAKARWEDPDMRLRMGTRNPGNSRGTASIKGLCFYCGGEATERDHKIPKSRGGTDGPANIALACIPCNLSKGRLTADEFIADLERRRRS